MSKQAFDEVFKKHIKNQEKIGESWALALNTVRKKIHTDFDDKRKKIKDEIKDLMTKQNDLINKLSVEEKQTNEELDNISKKLDEIYKKQEECKTSDGTSAHVQEVKTLQMNNIWSETVKDLDMVFSKQKDRITRLDQTVAHPIGPEPIDALKEQQKTLFDTKTKNFNEFIQKLEKLRKDIETTENEIKENERLENEKTIKLYKDLRIRENEEKVRLWFKFLEKFKQMTKK